MNQQKMIIQQQQIAMQDHDKRTTESWAAMEAFWTQRFQQVDEQRQQERQKEQQEREADRLRIEEKLQSEIAKIQACVEDLKCPSVLTLNLLQAEKDNELAAIAQKLRGVQASSPST
jgi:hypothetical protein